MAHRDRGSPAYPSRPLFERVFTHSVAFADIAHEVHELCVIKRVHATLTDGCDVVDALAHG